MIDIFANEVFPFTVALMIMLAIALIEGVGLLLGTAVSSIIDNALPELDLDIDVSGAASQGALVKILGWMNVGKVPLLIIFVVFLMIFSIVGYAFQSMIHTIFGSYLPVVIAVILALFITFPVTRMVTNGMKQLIPKDETSALKRENFIGMVATITLGEARKNYPAEAKFKDSFNQTHYVMVEPEEEEAVLYQGDQVILSAESEKKGSYYAFKNENNHLVN